MKHLALFVLLIATGLTMGCATGQYAEIGPQGAGYTAWAVSDLGERVKNWIKPESQIYARHYRTNQEICLGVTDGQGSHTIKYSQRYQWYKIDPKIPTGCHFCGACWKYADTDRFWGINPEHPYFFVRNLRNGEHVIEITIQYCNAVGEVVEGERIYLAVYMCKSRGDRWLEP